MHASDAQGIRDFGAGEGHMGLPTGRGVQYWQDNENDGGCGLP